MGSTMKNFVFWLVCAFVIFLFWSVSSRIQRDELQLGFSDFMTEVEAGRVDRVIFRGETIVGDLNDGRAFRTVAPPQAGPELIDALRAQSVTIEARDPNETSWVGHIISWLPIVIMLAFLTFFIRQLQAPRQRAQSWTEDQQREIKMSILYRLTEKGSEVSEDEIVAELVEPGRPAAETVAAAIKSILYEMVSDGTLELTPEKKFRARHIAPND